VTDELMVLLDGNAAPDALLGALMPALAKALGCDRCMLFLRDPGTRKSRATHAWARKPEFALAREDAGWQVEPPSLPEEDPMFGAALRNPEALFINDVTTADPALVNATFELEHFKHRALVHAPIYHDGLMYGILEPCVIGAPRAWSAADRGAVELVQQRIAPAVAAYVAENCC
jgi:GAF domain-containing protein